MTNTEPVPLRPAVRVRAWRRLLRRGLLVLALALLPGGCETFTPDPAKPHHVANSFRNNHPHAQHGLGDLLKWRWDRLMGRIPPQPDPRTVRFPLAHNDPAWLRANREQITLTWVGHATFLLQVGGLNILTDPQFSERASPFAFMGPQRIMPPGLALEELPPIDVVIVSHNHYDHLDLPSLRRLDRQWAPGHRPRFFVPLGNAPLLAGEGIDDVVELDWWEQATFRGLALHAVPVQHFSARTLFDRNEALWAGWVLEHPRLRFFFTGDTGYSADFLEIGARLGPMDLSAIAIGHYAPRWFMEAMHVNPEEAVRVHKDVRSRFSVGMHWGTFPLTDEPLDEPPRRLAAAAQAAHLAPGSFIVMQHGETRVVPPRAE